MGQGYPLDRPEAQDPGIVYQSPKTCGNKTINFVLAHLHSPSQRHPSWPLWSQASLEREERNRRYAENPMVTPPSSSFLFPFICLHATRFLFFSCLSVWVWYNQFHLALILHSFFTCSYFRILYYVLHLKNSSTSIRVKIAMIYTQSTHSISSTTPNDYTVPRLLCKVQFSDHVTSFPATMTQ